MITFYCPACWAEIAEDAASCPRCGADVRGVLEGRSYVAKLIAALSHPEPSTPIRAARILGELKAAEAVGPLLELVRRPPDPYIQAAAVEALGRIGASEARATLKDLVENGPILASLQAAAALVRMEQEEEGRRR